MTASGAAQNRGTKRRGGMGAAAGWPAATPHAPRLLLVALALLLAQSVPGRAAADVPVSDPDLGTAEDAGPTLDADFEIEPDAGHGLDLEETGEDPVTVSDLSEDPDLLVDEPAEDIDDDMAAADVEADIEADPEPDAGADVEIETGADVEIETGADVEIETGADVEIETGADADAEAGGDAAAEAGADAEADAEGDAGDPCGDGTCDNTENCFACPDDCGECECSEFPDFAFDETQALALDGASAPLLGTSAHLGVVGDLGATDEDAQSCALPLEATGEVTACAVVVGAPEQCASGDLTGGGTCSTPADCLGDEPVFTCDAAMACCQGTASGQAEDPATWEGTQAIGPLSCTLSFQGEVTGALSVSAEFGPGCECSEGRLGGAPSAAVAADGSGSCAIHRFGRDYAGDITATTCAIVTLEGSTGCGLETHPESGSQFAIEAEPLQMDWFRVNAYRMSWSEGIDCP